MAGHRPGDQRVVEFEPSSIDASLLPATQVRDKRIVERALFAQLQSQVGRHARLVPAKKGISGNHRGAHQGEDERAVGDVIARQTAIQKRYAFGAVTPVDPVLGRKLLRGGTLNAAERDFVEPLAARDRSRDQHAVADEFIIVEYLGLNIHTLNAAIEAHSGSKPATAERMRYLELRPYRTNFRHAAASHPLVTQVRPSWSRQAVFPSHSGKPGAVQRSIQLPEIAAILLLGDDVRGAATERIPRA